MGIFSKSGRANKKINQGVREAQNLASPRGFQLNGLGSVHVGKDGTLFGNSDIPGFQQNLGLANRGVTGLLESFNSDNVLDNEVSNSLRQLTARRLGRQRESRQGDLRDNLNARGLSGGSFAALRESELDSDFDDRLGDADLQSSLSGLQAYLQLLGGLQNSAGLSLNQGLAPVQVGLQGFQANNNNRLAQAQIPLRSGLAQGQVAATAPDFFDQFLKPALSGASSALTGGLI